MTRRSGHIGRLLLSLLVLAGSVISGQAAEQEWRFPEAAAQWQALQACELTPQDDALQVKSTGSDPHFSAPVVLPAGWNKVTIDATFQGRARGQLFWATADSPFGETQSAAFDARGGSKEPSRNQITVYLKPEQPTTQLRIDPLSRAGTMWIHAIRVTQEEPPTQSATPVDKISVLDGYQVELIYNVPGTDQGSWVSLTADPQGRLLASDQYGKLYRITPPAVGSDETAKVEVLDVDMGMCQGLLYAFDSLYAMVNGRASQGPGLYRLRDTNGDDQFDEVKLLRGLQGGGEHGPHAIILSPDGQSLYVCAGNHTDLTEIDASLLPQNWAEDQLLPRMWDAGGHAVGRMAPGGWICQVDPEGQAWTLVAAGFRNEYDIAFSPEGELFTYDADMEWDVGTPWYRPTRVNHVTSGAEFGWRSGTGKWPEFYPDSLPSVVDIGPGSPTGVVFGTGANFPADYQRAMFISDWSYGVIYAVHLEQDGATFSGVAEKFCSAPALQVSDLVVGPHDGALYFTIGGRRTQSGLYRITYVGDDNQADEFEPAPVQELNALQQLRRRLEKLHRDPPANAVEIAWPYLNHSDRHVRYAARIAIEHQPVQTWRERVAQTTGVEEAILASIALSRCGEPSDLPAVIQSLAPLDWESLTRSQQLDLLRAWGLAIIRLGRDSENLEVNGELVQAILAQVNSAYPSGDPTLDEELCRLLVGVAAPNVAERTLKLLAEAPTQEEQIHYALCLRALKTGWTLEQREAYFEWFNRAATLRGGNSFGGFLKNIRDEAIATLDEESREALAEVLARRPETTDALAELKARPFVNDWTVKELMAAADGNLEDRDLENGRKVFATAQCYKCHRFQGQGGMVGPDLTAAGRRFNLQNLCESLVEPSKVVSDQYQATLFALIDGQQIVGRVVNLNGDNYMVQADMLNPGSLTNVNVDDIEEMAPSPLSMMPEGLLNSFTKDEVLDMIAFLRSGVDGDLSANSDSKKKAGSD